MARTHLVGISSNKNLVDRVKNIASDFDFNFKFYENLNAFVDVSDSVPDVMVFILNYSEQDSPSDVASNIQYLKYSGPDAFIILILNKKITTDEISFIKKSGANILINNEDVYESSFLEYVLSQIIRGSLIPIKGHELKENTKVDFKILTIMPLNKKIVPAVLAGEEIKPAKIEKLKDIKELYIGRDDIQKVDKYISENKDLSKEGISSRCRINYISLCKSHADLIFSLFDRSDQVTFSSGKQLLSVCANMASEMLINLSTLTDPWSIINNSTMGESGSVERSPAIASMAGLMSINVNGISTDQTILAGLLCNIGMITLPPAILKKIRDNQFDKLTPDELTKYKNHPQLSIDKCLEKKLPLDNKIKTIIMATHEKFDGTGFPGQVLDNLIPKESQILQYCEFIDEKLLIKMGVDNIASSTIQAVKLEEELLSKKILDVSLTFELKKFLSLVDTTNKS